MSEHIHILYVRTITRDHMISTGCIIVATAVLHDYKQTQNNGIYLRSCQSQCNTNNPSKFSRLKLRIFPTCSIQYMIVLQ